MIRHEMQPGQTIPQLGINPEVCAAPLVRCVGGPCDGVSMRCPVSRVLILVQAIDGMRAVSLPPGFVALSKRNSEGDYGYRGHYVPGDDVLNWVPPTPEAPDDE